MFGYLIGGTSFGFLSFQAYRKRQEKKKTDSINQQIYDHILSPEEWTEGEDVYALQSQLQSKQLKVYNNQEIGHQQKFLDRARNILFNNFLSLRINQWILVNQYNKQNNDNEINLSTNQNIEINNHNINEIQIIDQKRTGLFYNIYSQFKANFEKRNEEKQQQQLKKSLISSNFCKKNGNLSSPNSSSSIRSQTDEKCFYQNTHPKLLEGQNMNNADTQQGYNIPISQFEKNFNESIINKKSIIYQEYKGNQPQNALKEFIAKCKKQLSFKSAMIIHYYYGKGDPSSYVLAVEQNSHDNSGLFNCNHGVDGANLATLKKTDAFKFEYDFKSHNCQQHAQKLEFNKWIEFQSNQKLLKQVLEQEIESKMHISEVFSLDDNDNIINYSVQVPFGQNESTYDLRSKAQTSEINYHDSFRQFDVCKESD